eukprot:10291419-Ditylum_brightwellii.AAC.1
MDNSNNIMNHLLACNKRHLHQAWETPFTTGPLQESFGDYGLGQAATEILEGDFDPNKSKNIPAMNYWLKHNICCALPPSLIHTNLTVDAFKALVRIQLEMMSSSLSGWHYIHYKATLMEDSICLVHATMMTLPFRFGFTPLHWQKAIDVMLEKDIGDPKIN